MLVTIVKYVSLILCSYLLGSVLFAKVLSKTQKDDITKHDSGNPGTMNMLRTHGVVFGACTFVLDALKGVIAALAGYLLFGGSDGGLVARAAIYIGGVSAVIGHMFPIFFKFKGGKGVATASGIAFVAHPIIGASLLACYIVLLLIIRIGSLSSLLIAIAYLIVDTVMLIIEQNFVALILLYIVVALIIWAHRSNIKRLINKNENVVDLNAAVQKDIDRIHANKEKRKQKSSLNKQTKTDLEANSKSDNAEENKTQTSEINNTKTE